MSHDFPEGKSKRERMLEWMRHGDASRVPVLIGPGFYLAASYFKMPLEEVTWPVAARAAVETHTQNQQCIGSPLPFDAIPFTDKLSLKHEEEALPDGTSRRTSYLATPRGTLKEVWEKAPNIGGCKREFYVKGPEDLPAFESFIRTAVATILEKPAVREKVMSDLLAHKAEGGLFFPIDLWVFCPTVELASCYYMDQATAIFTLYDQRELMEELFELHWKTTELWLDLGRKVDVDIFGYAINGLEWLSPDLYERYMIPQAKRINDYARSIGKLSWLHTCGKKKGLIQRDAYARMGVDYLESLSAPPTGDIDDYAWARAKIGSAVTTRGGVNCEFFYADDVEPLKAHAHKVLDGCRGYRHMIGDTNSSVPPYAWEGIQAVIDVVRERGAMFD
ncbi:MAG: uroporphyrinogen decarboxylase family protein [Planctomycetota bacterium]